MILSQKIKDFRIKSGMSQEALAAKSGVSLRTIQRIENNETSPRGDTLKRISSALGISTEDFINVDKKKDKNYLVLLGLSPLSFLVFPLFGIIAPLLMWLFKRNDLRNVNKIGKIVMDFQISLIILILVIYALIIVFLILGVSFNLLSTNTTLFTWQSFYLIAILFYVYNTISILFNSLRIKKGSSLIYFPSFKILT
ncbi:helix-turn-helix domain-containing protein [Christiangramia sp.]|uniref:helix-turn-helix domain-containing protein n=1 Tax=Christiangramia sp. TaxID=1931228 RepID=UPI00260E3219|nr:helix-turn-helix domain-containing protein [Christiangramia sp.]